MSIVLGYDESPGAQRALGYAADLAGLLNDTLVLVYGVEPPGRVGEEFTEHSAALTERGREILGEAREVALQRGIQTIVELVEDKPVPALIAAANKHDARLIVVGTYAESPDPGRDSRVDAAQAAAPVEPAGAVRSGGGQPGGMIALRSGPSADSRGPRARADPPCCHIYSFGIAAVMPRAVNRHQSERQSPNQDAVRDEPAE